MTNYIRANVISSSASIDSNIQIEANINSELRTNENIYSNPSTYNAATTTKKGIIRIATDEEAIAGILDNIAITPRTLKLATNYVHEQAIASDTWVINHNLNKYPSITLTYTSGEMFMANTEYVSLNQVIINLDSATTGYAYLN